MQVGISTAEHLPKTVLCVATSAGYAFQSAATPYYGGLWGKHSFDLNISLNIITAFFIRENI